MAQWARRLLPEHGDLSLSEPSHVAIETATFSVKEDTGVFLKSIFFPLGHINMAVRMLVSFVSCTQTRATGGRGSSVEELPSSDWPVSQCVQVFSELMIAVGKPSPFWVVPSLVWWSHVSLCTFCNLRAR